MSPLYLHATIISVKIWEAVNTREVKISSSVSIDLHRATTHQGLLCIKKGISGDRGLAVSPGITAEATEVWPVNDKPLQANIVTVLAVADVILSMEDLRSG